MSFVDCEEGEEQGGEENNNQKAPADDRVEEKYSCGAKSLLSTSDRNSVYLYKIDCADGFGLLNYSMFKSSPFTHSTSPSYATEKICRRCRQRAQKNFHFTKGEQNIE